MRCFREFAFAMGILMSGGTAALACTPSYVIEQGDTLSEIALENLGSIFAYQTIYDANRSVLGENPDLIFPGTELTIPCTLTAENPIDWSVMPAPETLARLIEGNDIQVVDIRSAGRIEAGVIPGAISIPYSKWRGPSDNPGQPPSEVQLAALYGENGLRLDKPTIIVHSVPSLMDNGRAALVYWLLKSSGAETLAIMRGGMKAWKDAGLPLDYTVAEPPSYVTDVTFDLKWRADEMDVFGIATDQIPGHLLDARPYTVFRKLDDLGNAVANTLPTARNAPIGALMSELLTEVDPEQGTLRVINHLQSHEADWTKGQVISFCNTGEVAALNWFYASELAGLDNMRLYPESVVGWSSYGGKLDIGDG